MKINTDLHLKKLNVSLDEELGSYYQDLKPAIYHFDHNSMGEFDEADIPFLLNKGVKEYHPVYIIQYGLIQHEIYLSEGDVEAKNRMMNCLNWLDANGVEFKDAIVWQSPENEQYELTEGWVSSMTQGQAISLYLRAYQLTNDSNYLQTAQKAYDYFKYDYSEGGVKRTDENGYIWLEEYPTNPPSYVFNGFVYTLLGILDLYRVTRSNDVLELYNACIETLENNAYKYHRWYWSVYDQKKEELVSYYYQKNVHIPLMEILFELTENPIFKTYAEKWNRQLNSSLNRLIVVIMYRVQPRLKRLKK